MLSLDEKFLIGKYRKVFEVTSERGNPLEEILKLMFLENLIDGLLTCSEDGFKPELILSKEKVKVPKKNACFGINSFLKKAVQKYSLSKLAVLAPSCVFDGINKTQYYGIGCNWTKTAIAIKIGILCPGNLKSSSFEAELLDISKKIGKVERIFFEGDHFFYEVEGEDVKVPIEIHHRYISSACRYCLNLSAKGSDITYVPIKEENRALFIVRSERGWSTIGRLQMKYPGLILFKKAEEKLVDGILEFLRRKMLLNIGDIIDRIELGLPLPKWNDQKLRKFYKIWNSINFDYEEEVF
jgi:coenzyme F420 hydrogenase subunit beta